MYITQRIAVFGFGSFFAGNNQFRDVDILLVHADYSGDSCKLAIRCKQYLTVGIKNVHITMLSKNEEQQLDFVRSTQAKALGVVQDHSVESDLGCICRSVGQNS